MKLIINITFFSLIIMSSLSQAKASEVNYVVLPKIKEEVVSYAIKNASVKEAYSIIKNISLSAIEYIQTDGEKTSDELEALTIIVTNALERESVFMSKDDVIATIISSLNS